MTSSPQSSFKLTSTQASNPTLNIAPYSLQQGTVYSFTLRILDSTGALVNSQRSIVQVASAPSGGACAILPPSGTSLDTLFSVSCDGFSNGLQFDYALVDGANTVSLSSQSNATVSTRLPQGQSSSDFKRIVRVTVTQSSQNSIGANRTIDLPVTVRPSSDANINATLAQVATATDSAQFTVAALAAHQLLTDSNANVAQLKDDRATLVDALLNNQLFDASSSTQLQQKYNLLAVLTSQPAQVSVDVRNSASLDVLNQVNTLASSASNQAQSELTQPLSNAILSAFVSILSSSNYAIAQSQTKNATDSDDAHSALTLAQRLNTVTQQLGQSLSSSLGSGQVGQLQAQGLTVLYSTSASQIGAFTVPQSYASQSAVSFEYDSDLYAFAAQPKTQLVAYKGQSNVPLVDTTLPQTQSLILTQNGEVTKVTDSSDLFEIVFLHSQDTYDRFIPSLQTRPPQCQFWNTATSAYDTAGCQYDATQSDRTQTVCMCNHLTNFAAALQLIPKVNALNQKDITAFTAANLRAYPIPLILLCASVLVFLILLPLVHCRDQARIRARRDKKIMSKYERHLLNERLIASSARPFLTRLQLAVWRGVRFHHRYIAVAFHRVEEPFSGVERLCVVFTLVFTSMAINAVFFAQVQTQIGDLVKTIISSLASVPVCFALRALFVRSSPPTELQQQRMRQQRHLQQHLAATNGSYVTRKHGFGKRVDALETWRRTMQKSYPDALQAHKEDVDRHNRHNDIVAMPARVVKKVASGVQHVSHRLQPRGGSTATTAPQSSRNSVSFHKIDSNDWFAPKLDNHAPTQRLQASRANAAHYAPPPMHPPAMPQAPPPLESISRSPNTDVRQSPSLHSQPSQSRSVHRPSQLQQPFISYGVPPLLTSTGRTSSHTQLALTRQSSESVLVTPSVTPSMPASMPPKLPQKPSNLASLAALQQHEANKRMDDDALMAQRLQSELDREDDAPAIVRSAERDDMHAIEIDSSPAAADQKQLMEQRINDEWIKGAADDRRALPYYQDRVSQVANPIDVVVHDATVQLKSHDASADNESVKSFDSADKHSAFASKSSIDASGWHAYDPSHPLPPDFASPSMSRFPKACKYLFAYPIFVLWILVSSFVILIYGLKFDRTSQSRNASGWSVTERWLFYSWLAIVQDFCISQPIWIAVEVVMHMFTHK